MENKGAAFMADDSQHKGGTNERAQGDVIPKEDSAEDTTQCYASDPHRRDVALNETPKPSDPSTTTEVNMEATINPDDVVRAGGFGARDDISSFLPVASDSTDFESSLLDARDYEEPQGEQHRPGLGWSKEKAPE